MTRPIGLAEQEKQTMFTKTAIALAIVVASVSGALAATKRQTTKPAPQAQQASAVYVDGAQQASAVYVNGRKVGSDPSWYVRQEMLYDSERD